MTLKKSTAILLCLCLVFSLAAIPVTSCLAAERTYIVSETQLMSLEMNNNALKAICSERETKIKSLEKQLTRAQTLLQEASTQSQSLESSLKQAQESSAKTNEYIKKLEKQVASLNISKVAPVLAYGNKAGFMAGLRLKTSPHYDISLVGNTKSFVMSVAYNF